MKESISFTQLILPRIDKLMPN